MNVNSLSVNFLRVQSVNMIELAKSGHPGVCLGAAPIFFALYKNAKIQPKDPAYFNRDRVCFSAGHASALVYATLNLFGFDLSTEELKRFRRIGSITNGHPVIKTPGIDASTGPLGQGIANAVGMAIAEQHLAAKYNKENYKIFNHYTYAFVGDGCLMEGVSLEAISLAGSLKLNKLIALYDSNDITIEGSLSLAQEENVKQKFLSQNWNVIKVNSGNSVRSIELAISKAKKSDKPTLIIVRTAIGYGSPVEGKAKAHGSPIGEAGVKYLKQKLRYNFADFVTPEAVVKNADKIIKNSQSLISAEKILLDSYKREFPEEYKSLLDDLEQKPIRMNVLDLDYSKEISTRDASHMVLNKVKVDNLIGGCADLAPSTKAFIAMGDSFSVKNRLGKNIHFGIREHAMGAITNGIVLHGGLRAFCSTFLVFSSYMLASIRMAALMNIPTIYFFSHDSIAVGQDGSTHQPVEQLGQLRLTPNLSVIRPANLMETLTAYYIALNAKNPTAIITSRQNLTTFESSLQDALKGGYQLFAGKDCTIIATGSEVDIALKVRKKLASKNIDAAVVSMPSVDIFEKQSKQYQENVLNKNKPIYVIEASNDNIWYKLGAKTLFNVEDFGFTASGEELYEHFGITPEKISKKIITDLK